MTGTGGKSVMRRAESLKSQTGYQRSFADDKVRTPTASCTKGIDMKLFLRGMLAAGLFAIASGSILADTPAPPIAPTTTTPPINISPSHGNPAPLASAPASTIIGHGQAGCGCGGDVSSIGSAGVVLGSGGISSGGRGRFGRRIDALAERYLNANNRLNSAFERLAGPPVYPTATGGGFGFRDRPTTQPGTVVFPQHPFARSPRDFFMTEQP